jgi:hypothetical protein
MFHYVWTICVPAYSFAWVRSTFLLGWFVAGSVPTGYGAEKDVKVTLFVEIARCQQAKRRSLPASIAGT